MNIKEIKDRFGKDAISKQELIEQMYVLHKVLVDFADNLPDTEIAKIEITDNRVLFTSRETDTHPGNVKIGIDIRDKRATPLEAFNFNKYEQEESEMLYKLVPANGVVFDIGANIGWYSNHLAKKYPDLQIYAFEPIPETFDQLKRNTEINEAENIRLNNFAFSDKKETLTFFYSPYQTGASSSVNITGNEEMKQLNCETDTIDNFCTTNHIAQLDFIKCDVEGGELMVFKGGAHSMEQYKPIIFTEMLRKWSAKFGYHPNDIIQFLGEMGYACYVPDSGKLEKIISIEEYTVATNFFFLHSEKHATQIKEFSEKNQ